jgi:hypothetical protein
MPEKLDRSKIAEELELMQLQEAKERLEDRAAQKNQRANRSRMVQASLEDTARRHAFMQSRCAHRKGGKGVAMLFQGNDANFAVVKHILSHGPMLVVCQRCWKVWLPPNKALNRKGATPEDRKEYKRLYEEYQWAVNLPTDNETSGTKLFEFHEEAMA